MKLVDAEIGHIDWAAYPCPCGRDGEHVATLLRTLLASGTRFNRAALEGHVMVSSSVVGSVRLGDPAGFLAALRGDFRRTFHRRRRLRLRNAQPDRSRWLP